MSESKHTSGPWALRVANTVVAKRLTGHATNNGILYVVDVEGNDVACLPRFSNDANARLIAAAPDGLKLAEAVLAADIGWDVGSVIPETATQWKQIVDLARRVVEAAEPKEER